MLLRRIPVNATGSGATALHRASFSGAVATMRLLLADPDCALLQTDTSFGDYMTPLHKAASGGRYLAVQLLVDALAAKDELHDALVAVDNMGRTPVEVARDKQQDQDEEQKSVARWDVVAGGTADWGKCVQLLLQASGKTRTVDLNNDDTLGRTSGSATSTSSNLTQQPLPEHLAQGLDCLDCDENGRCLTSSWETAFRAALMVSVGSAISGSPSKPNAYQLDRTPTMDATIPPPIDDSNAAPRPSTHGFSNLQVEPEKNASLGQNCTTCGTNAIVLYKCSSDGQLVCKTCRRRKRLDPPK